MGRDTRNHPAQALLGVCAHIQGPDSIMERFDQIASSLRTIEGLRFENDLNEGDLSWSVEGFTQVHAMILMIITRAFIDASSRVNGNTFDQALAGIRDALERDLTASPSTQD